MAGETKPAVKWFTFVLCIDIMQYMNETAIVFDIRIDKIKSKPNGNLNPMN